jgi:hypothetical protein
VQSSLLVYRTDRLLSLNDWQRIGFLKYRSLKDADCFKRDKILSHAYDGCLINTACFNQARFISLIYDCCLFRSEQCLLDSFVLRRDFSCEQACLWSGILQDVIRFFYSLVWQYWFEVWAIVQTQVDSRARVGMCANRLIVSWLCGLPNTARATIKISYRAFWITSRDELIEWQVALKPCHLEIAFQVCELTHILLH